MDEQESITVTETPAESALSVPSQSTDGEATAPEIDAFTQGMQNEGLLPDATEEKSEAAKPETPAPVEAAKPEAKPEEIAKAAEDKAIADLGIKNERAKEKFRELSKDSRDYAAVKARLPQLEASHQEAQQWRSAVHEAGASQTQLQQMFSVVKAINSKQPELMNLAADALYDEVKGLFKTLGRDLPGAVDPLDEFPDLKEAVETDKASRAMALETARTRKGEALRQTHSKAQQQADDDRQQFDTALQTATAGLKTLATQLSSGDAQFTQKLPYLQPTLDMIKTSVHPSRWVDAVREAYLKIPALPAAPPPQVPKPTPGAMPIRPTGAGTAVSQVRKFSRDEIANGTPFDVGLADAR